MKLFAKSEKELKTLSDHIKLGYRDGIWPRKMKHAHNENWQTTNDGRIRTTK